MTEREQIALTTIADSALDTIAPRVDNSELNYIDSLIAEMVQDGEYDTHYKLNK